MSVSKERSVLNSFAGLGLCSLRSAAAQREWTNLVTGYFVSEGAVPSSESENEDSDCESLFSDPTKPVWSGLKGEHVVNTDVAQPSHSVGIDLEVELHHDDDDVGDEVLHPLTDLNKVDRVLEHSQAVRFGTGSEDNESELKKIRDFVCKGCKLYNGGSCIRSFEEEFILGLRVNMSSLSDFEKDLILLGKISCHFQNTKLTQSTKKKTKTERQHQRTEHYVNGTRVCREAFKFLHCISQNKLTALLKHYKEFGLTPRVKKSGGRRRAEKRLLTHEDICLPQRPPDVNPPGLDAEQQDYLFENICEHTKDISCPKPATAAERRDTTDMTDNTNQAPAAQPKKRERNSSLDQQDAELPQIKEEQEEVCSSRDGEQLVVKQETDDIIVWTGEERLKLLDNIWKPEISLRSVDLPQQHDCKEEVFTGQQVCNQERNSSMNQEDPEPPKIKEEQEEPSTSHILKQKIDTFMVTCAYKEHESSGSEPNREQLLSPKSESQDQEDCKHVDSDHLTMGKSSELSQDLRNLIVAKHTDGIGYRRISKLLKVPVSTVGAIIRKWKEHHFTVNRPRTGAPRKISDRGVQRIIRRVVQEPRITCGELQKDLESVGTIVSKKTIINALNRYGKTMIPNTQPRTLSVGFRERK